MKDLFQNYELQREELLARIAQSLQLDETRKKRMEDAYNSIAVLLNNDTTFFKDVDIDVYPQGSTATGTTVKPLRGNEFDLDIVIHIKRHYKYYTPTQIYNALLKILESDGRYKDKIERKNRCVRLNYSGDFHMDILPGCLVFTIDDNNLKVPDRELKDWSDSNPKDLAKWFLSVANTVKQSMLKTYRHELIELRAEIQDLPEDDFYEKTPLQRAVQLVKRYRDIFFENNPDFATSSVVLTTLMGQNYLGESSIYDTIENVIDRIRMAYSTAISSSLKFKVLNPVNDSEDFTDKWTDKHYQNFIEFIVNFHNEWQQLKQGFEKSHVDYIKLFGEGVYKQSLQEQIKQMSKYSNNEITKANALIITNNAYTNPHGKINDSQGNKNEKHNNFGE